MSIYNPRFDAKPSAATPLTGTEIMLLSQGGVAVNVTINQILNNTSGLATLTAALAVETAARIAADAFETAARIAANTVLAASIVLPTSNAIVNQGAVIITTQSGNALSVQ